MAECGGKKGPNSAEFGSVEGRLGRVRGMSPDSSEFGCGGVKRSRSGEGARVFSHLHGVVLREIIRVEFSTGGVNVVGKELKKERFSVRFCA